MRMALITAACLLVMAACDEAPTATEKTPVGTVDQGPAPGLEHDAVEIPPASAHTKRLSVDMLDDSLEIVAGYAKSGKPIEWRFEYYGKEYLAFDILGSTLGKPDYVQVTEENLEPSSLYIKFMHDMASDVCAKMVDADKAKPTGAEDRTLTRFANVGGAATDAQTNENLRYLKLRFHADRIADDDDEAVADLKAVFDAAKDDAETQADWSAWGAVCVALFTSPSFHLY